MENKIQELVESKSKHSDYQVLHKWLQRYIDNTYQPVGKSEKERQVFIKKHINIKEKSVLDIGANTGFFTFSAVENGALDVTAIEGNAEHANFIVKASKLLNLSNIEVKNIYYDFFIESKKSYDVCFCLNVLHHLGDDFGSKELNVKEAKSEISKALNNLSNSCELLWFQLGFNWKGDINQPLFLKGLKSELIEFVEDSIANVWDIQKIGIYNPITDLYELQRPELLEKYDSIGEFRNRPLFLLKKLK